MNGPVFVKTDGSVLAESHPHGPSATIGYVVEDNGTTVTTGHETVTDITTSSCVTEYIALERALKTVLTYDYQGHIFIKTDSMNLVNLLDRGHSPRKPETADWIQRIKALLIQFDGYSVGKTDREFTAQAHNLANKEHT